MQGVAEGAANFAVYEGLEGAQSYTSTTEDPYLGEMMAQSATSATHGAVSGAALGVVGRILGGLGYNVGIKGNVKEATKYYEALMNDPTVSWDDKMKLNALLGIVSAERPLMDFCTYTTDDSGRRYVSEYAADGTLLSKHSYKTNDERDAIEYRLGDIRRGCLQGIAERAVEAHRRRADDVCRIATQHRSCID